MRQQHQVFGRPVEARKKMGAFGEFAPTQLGGLCLYAASTLLASMSLIFSKALSGFSGPEPPMPVMQLVFVRSCVLVACTAPHIRHAAARQLVADRPKLWLVRGVLGFASVALIQYAVSLLAISDAVALALLSPLVVAVAGTALLRERPPRLLAVALPLATAGALLLVKPAVLQAAAGVAGAESSLDVAGGLAPAAVGVAAGLGHVLSSAGAKLSVRRLAAGSTSPHAAAMIVLSAGLVSAAGSGLLCLWQQAALAWPRHAAGWLLLGGVGVMSFGHQAAMTAAMQRTPATRAAPLAYLSAVWSLLADHLVFGNPPSATSLLGSAAICAGGLLVTWGRGPGGGSLAGSPHASLLRSGSGSMAGELRRLVPLEVDANTGGAALPAAAKPAVERQRQAFGPVTPSLLQAALANAWVQARPGAAQAAPLKPPSPPRLHITDENELLASAAAVNAAVRMA